jgi:hypothetical protein
LLFIGGPDPEEDFMAYVGSVVLLSVFAAADILWAALRDRRTGRLASKRGSTLTRKFALPWQ